MPYGHIIRNATAAGGAVNHNMSGGADSYCCFIIQDVTAAGAQRALQRVFITPANKGATQITVTDNTAAGACNYDVLILEAHSLFDVGPVVAGATRAAGNVYSPHSTAARPAYRSLHRDVPFTSPGGVANVDVNIVHRLNTQSVVAFASPCGDMTQLGGEVVRCFLQAVVDANTVTMRIVCSAGANIDAAQYDWDIMILARTAAAQADVAPQPCTMRPHRATAGANIGLPSDDYSGADTARQQTIADVAGRPEQAYAALYTNVDAIVAGGVALTHNLGLVATNTMCIVGYSATPGAGWPVITNNATSATTLTIARQGADINNAYVYFVRPYSIVIPTIA